MTDPAHGTPLPLTVRRGVSDVLRVKGDYDPKLALARDGQVNVDLKKKGGYQEEFEIQFVNRRFQRGKPAVINLDVGALFDLVQACRTDWEEALESLKTMRPALTGAGE